MPVTNYHTCNGRILGETTAGVRTDYLTDALGSVTATVNSSQAIVNTYRYKPYGEQLAKTGGGADPRFGWRHSFMSSTGRPYIFWAYLLPSAAWLCGDSSSRSGLFFGGGLGRSVPVCGGTGAEWKNLKPVAIMASRGETYGKPCSEFKFETIWRLKPGTRASSHGAVVQRVTFTAEFGYCDKSQDYCGCGAKPITYIEAWPVFDGKFAVPADAGTGTSDTQDDSFMWGCGRRDCIVSKKVSFSGRIGYYDGCQILSGQAGWSGGQNHDACNTPWNSTGSGPLKGMLGEPAGFLSGPNKKELGYMTNCCFDNDGYYLATSIDADFEIEGLDWGGKNKCGPC